jgi:hypothetical protein
MHTSLTQLVHNQIYNYRKKKDVSLEHQRPEGSVETDTSQFPRDTTRWEAPPLKGYCGSKYRWEHHRRIWDSNAGGQRAHLQRMPTELELILSNPAG